jgi:hypothetical protein
VNALRQITMADVVSSLPTVQPLRCDPDRPRRLDLLITTLGFEERCRAVPRVLVVGESCRAEQVIVCTYETNATENEQNADALGEAVRALDHEPQWMAADEMGFADVLRRRLRELRQDAGRPLRVAWDISVTSNEVMLKLASVLVETDSELEVLYAEADVYFPTHDEYQADPGRWSGEDRMGLDRGTLNIRVSSEHPGEHSSQLPHHLILIPGYNRDRVRRVISKVEPQFLLDLPGAEITWLIGMPHNPHDVWRRDAVMEIHAVPDEHEPVELSTFHYTDTLLELERVYQRWALLCNLTVAPMGSKLQALGCALFCCAHPDVRVMFAQPEEYNAARYTQGVRNLWSVPLGPLDKLVGRLLDVGTLTREPTESARGDMLA